jgi:hypothetical protein
MANRSLGTLSIDLIAKIAGFEAGMDKAARSADKRMKDIQRSISGGFTSALKSVAAFGAAFLSIQTVIQGFKGAIDQADKLNDFTNRLGVSAEAISAWGYAASQTGTDIDALGKGLIILQKNMSKAMDPGSSQANLFKSLGLDKNDLTDAKGNLKELEEILPKVADAFKTLENDASETRLATDLFGKAGAELLEFLNSGSQGLDEFTAKAADLGIVLSQSTLTAADNFNDAVGDLKTATQGAIYQALEPLLPVLQSLIVEMVNFAKSGDGAKRAGEEAASGIVQIGTAAKSVYGFLVGLREGLSAFQQQAAGYTTLALGGGAKSLNEIEQSAKRLDAVFAGVFDASKAGKGAAQVLDPIDKRLKVDFKSLDQQAKDIAEATKKREALQAAVNGYLGNPTGKTPKAAGAKKTGKSDAEQEAERLQKAYESMNESLQEQVALFGQDGEAARVRYDIEHGALLNLTQAKKEELLGRAESLDMMRDEAKVAEELANVDKRRQEAVADVLADIAHETELLGLDAEAQETLNMLRYAGVDANTAYGQSIIDAASKFQELRSATEDQISLMDEFRSGAADALTDFVTGAKSAKDAFKDFADDMARRITQMIAEKWMEKLFGQQGSTGGGTSGGDWLGALFGAFFGGAKASGGPVQPGMMYRVNENRPELLTIGNNDYLMMGNKPGRIDPNPQVGSGRGFNQTNNLIISGPMTRSTKKQTERAIGRASRREMSRT